MVILNIICVNMPAKISLKIDFVRTFINIVSIPDIFRNDRLVHRVILCQNYILFPFVL